jgi:nitroreductase
MNQCNLLKEIYERRSLRALKEDKIPREEINTLVKAATLAPSCFNKQPWRFIAADEKIVLNQVFQSLTDANYWVKKCPAIIAVMTEISLGCSLSDRRDYALFDTGLAVMNMMLQAESMGIVAHPLAGFDPLKIKAFFKVPDAYIVIALVALGYRGGNIETLNGKHKEAETSARSRKPIDEILFYNRWL